MPWQRALLVIAVLLIALPGLHGMSHSGRLQSYASCSDGDSISYTWTFYEDSNPTGHPEWVGYDLYRRRVDPCGAYARLNDQPYPRRGGDHSYTYIEVSPDRETLYEYRVIFVDANRQEVSLGFDCYECVQEGWASCPDFSAPLIHGTLEDWGWTLFASPCTGCYGSFYLASPWPEELRQYAGTGQGVRLYGPAGCGTTEGCAMRVDHYDVTACPPTPALRASWGRLKSIYR